MSVLYLNIYSELVCDAQMPVKQRTWDVPVSSLQALSSSQESVTSEMNPPQWYSAAQVKTVPCLATCHLVDRL